MARVIVVSNRMAVPGGDAFTRAGGLEVALRTFLARHQGVWVGWSGRIAKGPVAPQTVERDGIGSCLPSGRRTWISLMNGQIA